MAETPFRSAFGRKSPPGSDGTGGESPGIMLSFGMASWGGEEEKYFLRPAKNNKIKTVKDCSYWRQRRGKKGVQWRIATTQNL